jgi:hypothetical protein
LEDARMAFWCKLNNKLGAKEITVVNSLTDFDLRVWNPTGDKGFASRSTPSLLASSLRKVTVVNQVLTGHRIYQD